ncbi:hypothetical protein [Nocardioides bruguierae]|uniref:Uncharacterized protein n=1 Tax=Nocardioides bruguierae TaxID=2945102 RepID=A0A9X2DBU5_9ACTN|nr:hypothetical protein [Nocardioides bruguierae]MCM0622805.1 hypothetical protein [Nocardioides bruguierae]
MNKKLISLLAVPALAATIAVALPAGSATANSGTWTCKDGGHTLTTNIYFTQDSVNHTWKYLTYELTGSGTGGKSNWDASFNDGTGERNYHANNQDDLDNDTLYTENFVDFTSKKSRTETWTASAAFDTRGTDNHCSSSLIY